MNDHCIILQGRREAEDFVDSAIDKSLKNNFKLAQDLKLVGTPTFIVTNNTFSKFSVIFGRANEEDLKQAISEVR